MISAILVENQIQNVLGDGDVAFPINNLFAAVAADSDRLASRQTIPFFIPKPTLAVARMCAIGLPAAWDTAVIFWRSRRFTSRPRKLLLYQRLVGLVIVAKS